MLLKLYLRRYNEYVIDFLIIDICICIELDINIYKYKIVYIFFKGGGAVEMKWGVGVINCS